MKLLTVPEACADLRVSRATFYKLVKRGALRIVKVGGKSLVPAEAIATLLGLPPHAQEAAAQGWEQYYAELCRLGLTTPASRQAIVAPQCADVLPIEVTGQPASEIIIEERGGR